MSEPATKRDAVRNLQRYLRRLSYEYPTISPPPVDGIFAARTEEALSAFQRLRALPVTGRADRETWDALFAEYRRITEEKERRVTPDFFSRVPDDYEARPEETSSFITLLQWTLNELRVIYDSLPLLSLSGSFDGETEAAVLEFQRLHGLPRSGAVNRALWNRIAEEYNQYGA